MARAPNEKVTKAKELFNKGYKLIDIAKELCTAESTVRVWKNRYKWNNETFQEKKCNVSKKSNNKKVKKKAIVDEIKEVVENNDLTDKQKLFCVIYSQCLNATKAYLKVYKCTYETAMVNGSSLLRNTKIKEQVNMLISEKCNIELLQRSVIQKYIDIAFADMGDYLSFGKKYKKIWTKDNDGNDIPVTDPETGEQKVIEYNNVDLKESSMVDTTLINEVSEGKDGIKFKLADKMKALEFLTKHCNLLSDEEKIKLDIENKKLQNEKLKAEVEGLEKDKAPIEEKEFKLPANIIAPAFAPLLFDIEAQEHTEYVLKGGRGSTKSSFISLEIINLLKQNPNIHACILRQVADTLRNSVYNQILWSISALGLENEFHCTTSPLEITYKATGQKIYFRGADDPDKIKSIKVSFGYIGVLWFEELDQFKGEEAVRKIEQSVIRGGDLAYIFKSFNPPQTSNNWANKYVKIPKATRYVHSSTYLEVPKSWLGKTFIEEAEHLKEVNPKAYEHEYMGEANGTGGNVFDNVTIRSISDEEIQSFDRLYFGVDWGYFPDKYAFTKSYYNSANMVLYIIDEYCCNKKSNRETAQTLIESHGIHPNDKVVCDSAEPKSIADYKEYGLFARGAVKGPDSVRYKMKWLQSLRAIIIDNVRCPNTASEFLDYEYERDKNGEIIEGYPDKDNHCIDSISYALEEVWRRRGN